MYELHRRNDQLYIMKIIAVVLLICLLITFIIYMDALPYMSIYAVFIIFGILIIYIIYYIYFTNPGRSKRYWDKKYFVKPLQESANKANDIDYESVDKKLDNEFNKYLDATCARPTPQPTPQTTPQTTPRA